MGDYAIVDTDREEIDSIEDGSRVPYSYTGEGGVEASGFWRRAMFSLRFQSIDILISDFVRDDSRFIWNRNIRDRVEKVAPFLEFDHNPYPGVVDGRVVWIVDAYTTTSNIASIDKATVEVIIANSATSSTRDNCVEGRLTKPRLRRLGLFGQIGDYLGPKLSWLRARGNMLVGDHKGRHPRRV